MGFDLSDDWTGDGNSYTAHTADGCRRRSALDWGSDGSITSSTPMGWGPSADRSAARGMPALAPRAKKQPPTAIRLAVCATGCRVAVATTAQASRTHQADRRPSRCRVSSGSNPAPHRAALALGSPRRPGRATGGAASRSAAKSTAKSVAKTAALDGLEVAAPEVAVPAAAAAKAAGAAGHVLKNRKDANGQTSGSRGQGSGGDVSPAPLRQPRAEPATSTAAAREPAQAATMASRSTGPAPSAHADPDARPPRGPATPAGTIDNDVPRHNDNPQPRAARPPRPPREIGPNR